MVITANNKQIVDRVTCITPELPGKHTTRFTKISEEREDLQNNWQIEPIATEHFRLWGYLIIVMSVIIILCVLATCLLKCKFKILIKHTLPCHEKAQNKGRS